MLFDNPEGWDGGLVGGTIKKVRTLLRTDSHCPMAEANTTL